jgi:hypothetical protein
MLKNNGFTGVSPESSKYQRLGKKTRLIDRISGDWGPGLYAKQVEGKNEQGS